jgi:hypothetical protein
LNIFLTGIASVTDINSADALFITQSSNSGFSSRRNQRHGDISARIQDAIWP